MTTPSARAVKRNCAGPSSSTTGKKTTQMVNVAASAGTAICCAPGEVRAGAVPLRECGRVGLLQDREIGRAAAVEADHVLLHCIPSAHAGDVAEEDRRPVDGLDGRLAEALDGVRAGVELDVVF